MSGSWWILVALVVAVLLVTGWWHTRWHKHPHQLTADEWWQQSFESLYRLRGKSEDRWRQVMLQEWRRQQR